MGRLSQLDDPEFVATMARLLAEGKHDAFFEKVCDDFCADTAATAKSITMERPTKRRAKRETIAALIAWRMGREEYEKCRPLQDILDAVDAAVPATANK